MRDVDSAKLIEAMKDCLRSLDDMKLFSPDDLDIIDQKRILRRKITKLERGGG